MTVFDEAIASGLDAARGVVEGALATAGKDLQRVTGERDAAVADLQSSEATVQGLRDELGAASAEVVRLTSLVDTTAEQLEVVTADRDLISSALASSEDDLRAAQSALADAAAQHEHIAAELAHALARIAELEAGAPDPDPEPVVRPLLGANPMTGGATSAAIARVTDRWGAGIAVRLFDGDDLSPAPAQGDAGRILISWKPAAAAPITEAQVAAAIGPLPAGSKVCVWHEPDVKYRKTLKASGAAAAKAEVDRYKARAREFYAIVKRIRPDLDVMAVLSEWTFSPSTNYNPLDYIELGTFDVLALDLDGGDPGPRNYLPAVAEAQEWMRANGVERWTVGEYGVKLEPGFTNADRVDWLNEQTTALLELAWPPEEICLFELDDNGGEGSKYILTTAPEQEAWIDLRG